MTSDDVDAAAGRVLANVASCLPTDDEICDLAEMVARAGGGRRGLDIIAAIRVVASDVRALAAKAADHRQAERAVLSAAINMVEVKREAQKVFRTGLRGMVQVSPRARALADETADAGRRLEQAVDAMQRGELS